MADRSRLVDILEYVPFLAFDLATAAMPLGLRNRFGGWCGRRVILNTPHLRKRILSNLEYIYPDKAPSERESIMTACAGIIGTTFAEVMRAQTFQKARDRIEVIDDTGLKAVLAAHQEGRPTIVSGGHFGPWEAGRIVLQHSGLNPAGIYRPLHNRFINAALEKRYAIFGRPMFPKGKAGTRGIIGHLKKGGTLCVMHDQKMDDGMILDFLGKPALTSTVTAELALKFKATLVTAAPHWNPDRKTIQIRFDAPVPHSDAETMTQIMNDQLSAAIHAQPEQWYWLHRRWRISQKILNRHTKAEGSA